MYIQYVAEVKMAVTIASELFIVSMLAILFYSTLCVTEPPVLLKPGKRKVLTCSLSPLAQAQANCLIFAGLRWILPNNSDLFHVLNNTNLRFGRAIVTASLALNGTTVQCLALFNDCDPLILRDWIVIVEDLPVPSLEKAGECVLRINPPRSYDANITFHVAVDGSNYTEETTETQLVLPASVCPACASIVVRVSSENMFGRGSPTNITFQSVCDSVPGWLEMVAPNNASFDNNVAAATTTAAATTPIATDVPKSNTGLIVGVVVVLSVILLASLIPVIVCCCKKYREEHYSPKGVKVEGKEGKEEVEEVEVVVNSDSAVETPVVTQEMEGNRAQIAPKTSFQRDQGATDYSEPGGNGLQPSLDLFTALQGDSDQNVSVVSGQPLFNGGRHRSPSNMSGLSEGALEGNGSHGYATRCLSCIENGDCVRFIFTQQESRSNPPPRSERVYTERRSSSSCMPENGVAVALPVPVKQ